MRLLDRYVLRNFFEPFLLCFLGFIGIWLLYDLQGNWNDFREYHVPVKIIVRFYFTQFPAIMLLAMPIAVLLALLFALSKMSRHNEVISMLTAGRSLQRILAPLMAVGVAATAISYWLNASSAPHAEAAKKLMLEEITRGRNRAEERMTLEGHLFRDRMHNRTWFVQSFVQNSSDLDGVNVSQQDQDGNITRKWYGARAHYGIGLEDPTKPVWTLLRGMIVDFDKNGDIIHTDSFPEDFRIIHEWTETPWRIASSQLLAQNLSVRELKEYLANNSDFPAVQLASYRANLADRFALPCQALVVIFLAAPLGVVYNRRGVLGGVASAIFLYFLMFILHISCMAMGKGARINPVAAAWFPEALFFAIGLILLYFRSSNRDIKLAFWK
jgi:LPS export ABC transporter permease LptG